MFNSKSSLVHKNLNAKNYIKMLSVFDDNITDIMYTYTKRPIRENLF